MNIKDKRHAMNLTTAEFGKLVGVSGRTIENWEQGRRNPSKSAQLLIERMGRK